MGRKLVLFTTLFLAVQVSAGSAAPLPLRPPGTNGPLGNERLSDERTLTRSAYANFRSRVRNRPSVEGKTIAKLRFHTEDGPPEVYLALESRVDAKGQPWVRIRIPARPNGQKGWVRRDALGAFALVRTHLVINRHTLRAKLLEDDHVIWHSPVGVGKASTPTPAGNFYARERLKALQGGTIYGPWAIGTSAYSRLTDWPGGGVVGIHGTNQPELIPGRPSHGCIRIPNQKITQLVRLMPVGTPITIL